MEPHVMYFFRTLNRYQDEDSILWDSKRCCLELDPNEQPILQPFTLTPNDLYRKDDQPSDDVLYPLSSKFFDLSENPWWLPFLLYSFYRSKDLHLPCVSFPEGSLSTLRHFMQGTLLGSKVNDFQSDGNWKLPNASHPKEKLNPFPNTYPLFKQFQCSRATLLQWLYQINQSCTSFRFSTKTFSLAIVYMDRCFAKETLHPPNHWLSFLSALEPYPLFFPYGIALVCLMVGAKYMEDFKAPTLYQLRTILQWYFPRVPANLVQQTLQRMEQQLLRELNYQLHWVSPIMALYEMAMHVPEAFPGLWEPHFSSCLGFCPSPLPTGYPWLNHAPGAGLKSLAMAFKTNIQAKVFPSPTSSLESSIPLETKPSCGDINVLHLPSPPSTPPPPTGIRPQVNSLHDASVSNETWNSTVTAPHSCCCHPAILQSQFIAWLPALEAFQLQLLSNSPVASRLNPAVLGAALYWKCVHSSRPLESTCPEFPVIWIFSQAPEWDLCQSLVDCVPCL